MKRCLFLALVAAIVIVVAATGCASTSSPTAAVETVRETVVVEVTVEKLVVVAVEVTATPTATPPPTPTLVPTAIVTVTPSSASVVYLTGMMEATEVGIVASFAIDDLLKMYDEEPWLFFDSEWCEAMAEAIALGRRYSEMMGSLEAPAKFAGVQRDLVEFSVYYDLTLDSLEAWLVNGNEASLDRYFFFVELATERLKRCYDELMPVTQGE